MVRRGAAGFPKSKRRQHKRGKGVVIKTLLLYSFIGHHTGGTALLGTGHILQAVALKTPGPIETLVLLTVANGITYLHTYKHVETS